MIRYNTIQLSPTYSRGGVGETVRACALIVERARQASIREQAETARLLAENREKERKNPPKLSSKVEAKPRVYGPTPKCDQRRVALLKRLTAEWQRQVDICQTSGASRMTTVGDINWLVEHGLVETRKTKAEGRYWIEVRAK
jgi:hypothetical protein